LTPEKLEPIPPPARYCPEAWMSAAMSELSALLLVAEQPVLDAILETTPAIAIITDSDGAVLRVTRYASQLSGWDPHELEGLSFDECFEAFHPLDVHGGWVEKHEMPVIRALGGERVAGWEGSFLNAGGERIPVIVNAAPFIGPDGRVIGAVSSVTDRRKFEAVTDLQKFKGLERELRSLCDELTQRTPGNEARLVKTQSAPRSRGNRTQQ
jgi:PAS domain S-box-containing protein